jgi:tryptophan-rich sensory protein
VLTAWLVLFFSYNVVFVALLNAFILAIFAMMLTAGAWQRSKIAFWLLVPYVMLTLYFLCMNLAVWLNN